MTWDVVPRKTVMDFTLPRRSREVAHGRRSVWAGVIFSLPYAEMHVPPR